MSQGSQKPAAPAPRPTPQRRLISDEVVEQRIRAQKRAAIGLAPERSTSSGRAYRPTQSQPAPLLRWSAVILAGILLLTALVAVVYLRPSWADWQMPGSNRMAGGQGVSLPTATALAPGEVRLLSYDFSTPVATMAQHNEPGRWVMGFVDGLYRIRTVTSGQLAYTSLGLYNPDPYRVETEAVILAETPSGYGGIIVRLQDARNYYLFRVNGLGQASAWIVQEGTLQDLARWSDFDAVRPAGETNHLAVIDDGQRIRFLVNGVQVVVTEPIDLPAGDLGLVSGSDDQDGSQTDFDWVTVVQIPGE